MESLSHTPPVEYWTELSGNWSGSQIKALRIKSERRFNTFKVSDLPPPQQLGEELLERFARDGWVEVKLSYHCPCCPYELEADEESHANCPECREAFTQHGGVEEVKVYERRLEQTRSVDWVVAIHGMNTTGAWQQEFNWLLGRTWGKSVPVAVYKYGIVRLGVLLPWRRKKFQNQLREKLARQSRQAKISGYSGKPDVIAHSFGTWLLGHLLRAEIGKNPEEQLRFGRIILTGCILRPDFDWKSVIEAGLVDDVLNHYGDKDSIVPMAQLTIWDSGPSGRIGFDGNEVINICEKGYGHSDLFSIQKCVVDSESFKDCSGEGHENSHLFYSHKKYWMPFLINPKSELGELTNHDPGPKSWKPLPWVLRGTLFPLFIILCLITLLSLLLVNVGSWLSELSSLIMQLLWYSGAGLASLGAIGVFVWFIRLIRKLIRSK